MNKQLRFTYQDKDIAVAEAELPCPEIAGRDAGR